jgi:hypothetical protein
MLSRYTINMNKSNFGSIPFIPGISPARPEFLARHLPPIPEGVVSTWLKANAPPGSWILDPFGASPRIVLEAAQAGYRVLVAANNPIIRFLLEMIADPPSTDQLKASLAELAASYVGDERIEPHIRSLYNTICARCGQLISADAFLWEHGNPAPYARIYTCPHCGDSGEHHCTPFDAEQSSKFISSGMHKARALERVVAYNDQDRIHVEQALSVYSPRALYGLITIINKLQGLSIPSAGQKHLSALLLYAFDQANSMWRPQAQNDRRRQLTIPRHSRENNIWCALEEGINKWSAENASQSSSATPVTIWPNITPETSGICIFEGRMLSLVDSVKDINIGSVCTALPRPNQAYWTLSALWAGWLWGREAVGAFKSVLHRQRYDWAWHATALASVFRILTNFLKPSTPILALVGEVEPGFIGSALVAAGVSGCRLESMALRPEEKQAQIIWKSIKNPELGRISPSLTQIANQSAKRYLELIAEPASYLSTISAALIGIIDHWRVEQEDQSTQQAKQTEILPEAIPSSSTGEPTPSLVYSSVYNSAREALSYRLGLFRYTLTDETNIEAATKSQTLQTSLFSLDTENIVEEDDEEATAEATPLSLNETISEKQRPTRSSDVSESTFLWLRETGEISGTTCSENSEAYLVKYLIDHPGSSPREIDQAVCAEFPGLLTPDADFIRLCLASYGLPQPQNTNHWLIRPEDDPKERLSDIARINVIIHQIGNQLDFICADKISSLSKPYISWQDNGSGQEYWFFTTGSATINEIVNNPEQPPTKGFIVIPASRTNLLIYKLRRDPRLNKAFNPSLGVWQFLKFRHLRSLSESPLLNRNNLEQMLSLDPLTFTTPQLWLI